MEEKRNYVDAIADLSASVTEAPDGTVYARMGNTTKPVSGPVVGNVINFDINLDGFVDYAETVFKTLNSDNKTVVLKCNHDRAVGYIVYPHNGIVQQERFAVVELIDNNGFPFTEELLDLQAAFRLFNTSLADGNEETTANKQMLLDIITNVKEFTEVSFNQGNMRQDVIVKKGVGSVATVTLQNPCLLCPEGITFPQFYAFVRYYISLEMKGDKPMVRITPVSRDRSIREITNTVARYVGERAALGITVIPDVS